MNLASMVTVAAMVMLGVQTTNRLRHHGLSDSDQFLLCATGVFGKPVFLTNFTPHPNEVADGQIACPSAPEVLVGEMSKRGIRTFQSDTGVYLVPERLFAYSRLQPYIKWKTIALRTTVTQWCRFSEPRDPSRLNFSKPFPPRD